MKDKKKLSRLLRRKVRNMISNDNGNDGRFVSKIMESKKNKHKRKRDKKIIIDDDY